MSRRILVTGGCGFIGSNFILHWHREHPEDRIVNLDALTYAANPTNLHEIRNSRRYTFRKGDVADPKAVAAAMRGVDVVVHFAAESHVDRSIQEAAPFLRTNVLGTQVLLEAARRSQVSRFHHVSTDEVFGDLRFRSRKKFDENSPYRPRSPYAASKAAADHFVRAAGATHGLPYTITNTCNNYGPFQFPEKVVPRFISNLIDGRRLPVYGRGANVREWVHVEDACRAIAAVLRKGIVGQTYCVGGEERTNLQLALDVAKEFGRGRDAIEFVNDRPGHDQRYALDDSKIRRELGWKPRRRFSEGLKATIQWYRDHESWWRPLKARAEAIYR